MPERVERALVTTWWTTLKRHISDDLGVGHDILHVPFGLLIFLGAAILLRSRRENLLLAFGVVTLLQLVNEVLDAVQWVIWTGRIAWGEALKDTALTLVLPVSAICAAGVAGLFRRGDGGRVSGGMQ
ncbi:hypothetical protein HKCCSP123_12840 [Rhodobacterales bacterium HKCCSP123]|nr:hypothetical protein [Rhodobacterales bacterium HKCCSP123]